ncbi:hypothetical protein EKE94_16180 [Mesobaculum littorinae]|uniref:Magnesium transporter MgtE intracellular domain-containing protein n=1 Tax=Mesobaculum littorinae TaxID=2486419 RepID=A0A438ADW3_9RHOB|nr:hypothetical protein [Mesobaculum littorinae]RVV96881.1 hypothetical protein EKE94_16180 [Mesobaculum littorinae]
MSRLRLVIGALALAGVAKGAVAVAEWGDVTGGAQALSFVQAAVASAPDPAPDPVAAAAQPIPTAAPAQCETPEEMLAAIEAERVLLDEQKERITSRQTELDLTAESVATETARLDALKGELEGLLARVEAAHTADLDRLVQLYRAMKPKEAAGIMNELDIEATVMIFGTMAERDAADILAAMNPVRVRAISKIILERSKLPGDQKLEGVRLQ